MMRQILQKAKRSGKLNLNRASTLGKQSGVMNKFRHMDGDSFKAAKRMMNQPKSGIAKFNGYTRNVINNESVALNGVQAMFDRAKKDGGFKESSWGFKISEDFADKLKTEKKMLNEAKPKRVKPIRVDDFGKDSLPEGKLPGSSMSSHDEKMNQIIADFEKKDSVGKKPASVPHGVDVDPISDASRLIKTSDLVEESIAGGGSIIGRSIDAAKGAGKAIKKGLVADYDLPGMTPQQKQATQWLSRGMVGSTLFIGGTALLDFAIDRKHAADAKRQNEEQLKRQQQGEADKREAIRRKAHMKSNFNATPDMGSLVFDMFAQRTGHHKMGNNKFQ